MCCHRNTDSKTMQEVQIRISMAKGIAKATETRKSHELVLMLRRFA